MRTRKTRALLDGLDGVQRQFEYWRRTRKVSARIPGPLWAAAVRMAGRYGLSHTAQALRVNYNALREHVQQGVTGEGGQPSVDGAHAVPAGDAVAKFVEWASPVSAGACECTLELENAGGAKMRVQLKSIGMPDLAAISQSFWNRQP